MQVIQVYMQNALRNFNYIIYSEKNKEAIFFDPYDLALTLPICTQNGLVPKYLVNTHTHHDHIKDNNAFLNLPGTSHIELEDGEIFNLADGDYIKAIYTPGHVMNHFCYLIYSEHKPIGVITGDALFNAGVGNCKNGGDVEVHYETTTNIIKTFPENLTIYPSHDYLLTNLKFARTIEKKNDILNNLYDKRKQQNLDKEFIPTTIEMEKLINPFLRLNSEEITQRFTGLSPKDIFIELRKLRDHF